MSAIPTEEADNQKEQKVREKNVAPDFFPKPDPGVNIDIYYYCIPRIQGYIILSKHLLGLGEEEVNGEWMKD